MSSQAKNQHYIPRFLLRKFEVNPKSNKDNRKVFLLHKQTKEIEKKKIEDICAVYLYNTRAQNKKLNRLDNMFSDSLKNYLNRTHHLIDIQILKYFTCILFCGTPSFRRNLIRGITEHVENQMELQTGSVIAEDDIKGKFDWTEICADALFSEIREWECEAFVSSEPVFITSDSPVKVNNKENGYYEVNIKNFQRPDNIENHEDHTSFRLGFEFANIDLKTDPWIYFPISPNNVLIFASSKEIVSNIRSEYESVRKEDLVRAINTFTFGLSDDYAISSKRELLEVVKPLINFAPETMLKAEIL